MTNDRDRGRFLGRAFSVAILLAGISALLPVKFALACSCAPPGSDERALEEASAVFSGTVVDVHDPQGDAAVISSGRTVTYTFEVDAVAKGDIRREATVDTAADGASCGYGFKEGVRYVVFADGDPERDLSTSSCSNTHPFEEGEELGLAAEPPSGADGDPEHPRRTSPGGLPVVAVVGVGVVVALAGIVLLITRRRGV